MNNCELCFACAVAYRVLEKVAPRSSKNDDSGEVREENMCGRPEFNEAKKEAEDRHAL